MRMNDTLDAFATTKLAELDERNLRRRVVDTRREDGIWAVRNGRRLMSFSCNDYLNLSSDPRIVEAAAAALRRPRGRGRRGGVGTLMCRRRRRSRRRVVPWLR